ncbi:multiubiquitin domain-containing protein [Cesiribacter sp. SM1]|uniref:multiubiquitin domain-containing protein n=1 Tax=Cesiribacter sp. SM1 TaxID=2861196 RepID=UPI001CD3AB33|nr:multiubiquitin domain-containing protein [Cesiribacter sp. SM1]
MKTQPLQPPPTSLSSERIKPRIREYKFFNIIVNGRMRLFNEKTISFSGVIALAFNAAAAKKCESFSVAYRNDKENIPEGVLKNGDFVAVRPGMTFVVERILKL